MKIRIIILIFLLGILAACSSNKEVAQRKNYMMPQKTDLARNSKYNSPKAKTTYKVSNQKVKTTKKVYGN
jgi:uncharacterized lipoprotein